MRVNAQTGMSTATQRASSGRDASGAAFTLAATQQPSGPDTVSAACNPATLDAILALQDLGSRHDRRRRAIRRGHALLDRLDQLRTCLLDGAVPATLLHQLREDLAIAGEPYEDGALQAVLSGIEVRAAVEIAKLDVANSGP